MGWHRRFGAGSDRPEILGVHRQSIVRQGRRSLWRRTTCGRDRWVGWLVATAQHDDGDDRPDRASVGRVGCLRLCRPRASQFQLLQYRRDRVRLRQPELQQRRMHGVDVGLVQWRHPEQLRANNRRLADVTAERLQGSVWTRGRGRLVRVHQARIVQRRRRHRFDLRQRRVHVRSMVSGVQLITT